MSKLIAIMQPTYLPWLGYLAMIQKVDQFVFLDHVQFDYRSWQQRNRIKTSSKVLWLTVSIHRKGLFNQKINEVVCVDLHKDVEKHLTSISHAYKKSRYYNEFFDELLLLTNRAVEESNGYLASYNMRTIKFLCNYAGIKADFILSSQLNISGQKGELLANICEQLGANAYLSPLRAKAYLENSTAFNERNIDLIYHDYIHPRYPQLFGEFLSSMSCIDAFFNVPKEGLRTLIMSGCQ